MRSVTMQKVRQWWYFAKPSWWDALIYSLSIFAVAVALLAFGWGMIVLLSAWGPA